MLKFWVRVAALLGMPLAGLAALTCFSEFPRLIWGGENPFLLLVGVAAWTALLGLGWALRWSLDTGPPAHPWLSPVLDFLALRRLHPLVKVGLAVLAVGPAVWILRGAEGWTIGTLFWRGREALASGDVHDSLDRLSVACQFGWTAGLPVAFGAHLALRWKPQWAWLPWVVVRLCLAMVVILFVLMVTLAHFSS